MVPRKSVTYTRTTIDTDEEHSNYVSGIMEATSIQVSRQKRSTPLDIHGKALLSHLDFGLLFQYLLDGCWDWYYIYEQRWLHFALSICSQQPPV